MTFIGETAFSEAGNDRSQATHSQLSGSTVIDFGYAVDDITDSVPFQIRFNGPYPLTASDFIL